ncbi:MAG: EAL domain-containing protein [Desulfovibrionaceae bacterium]
MEKNRREASTLVQGDMNPLGFIRTTPKGRVVHANEPLALMLGYDNARAFLDAVADNAVLYATPADAALLCDVCTTAQAFDLETALLRRDGTSCPVQAHYQIVRDKKGRRRYLECAVLDCTRLYKAEAAYRSLFDNAVTGIFSCTSHGRLLAANPALAGIFGYDSPQELLSNAGNMGVDLFVVPGGWERLAQAVVTHGKVVGYETQVFTGQGELIWVRIAAWLASIQTTLPVLEGLVEDIGGLKGDQWKLVESEEKFKAIFDNAVEGIFQFTPRGHLVSGNPALAHMLGYPHFGVMASAPGGAARILFRDPDRYQDFQEQMDGQGKVIDFEARAPRVNHGAIWVSINARTEVDAEGRPVLYEGSMQDISKRKEVEYKLQHQACHDALTGLANRPMFLDQLEKAIVRATLSEGGTVCVVSLDLNRFKVINDSLGHQVGDEVLTTISRRLLVCLGATDVCSRLSGDSFAILLSEVSTPDAAALEVDMLQQALAAPCKIQGQDIYVSASMGVVLASGGGVTPESLLRDADIAKYRAKKKAGQGYVFFDSSMRQEALDRMTVETGLRCALDRNEYRLYYQPIVSLGTGEVYAFEALLRWEKPGQGIVSPGVFIPLLEENGEIVEVGRWVLQEACRQMRQWLNDYPQRPKTKVSVNLSARQLMMPGVANMVRRTLEASGLPAANLKLEITESAVMERASLAREVLRELKAIGAALSLDDFGTGYSSLAYLHQFPVDTLKIDRSFVVRMDPSVTGSSGEAIVNTIVNLAKILGKEVVAEGVETPRQLAMLRALNCHYIQGYYYAKPLPALEAGACITTAWWMDPRFQREGNGAPG